MDVCRLHAVSVSNTEFLLPKLLNL